ncbi:hypothetical protein U6A24_12445 [Aquimarina gracilis]|uniref:Uncharacterized protein n=2 Tax=Aquimarina gracilis TaxID=874422 RepID=A0ABU5ZWN0_9FLAO|nr:hypothetical protein [Aquimarina gracilis]
MKTTMNFTKKIKNKILDIRTLFSAILYSTLLILITLSNDSDSIEYLYLEVYNITLLYIIINMLLFSKDILWPKTEHIFSKEFIEVLLITVVSTILIISLFSLKNTSNTETLSKTLIKIIAVLVIIISVFVMRKNR